MSTQFSITKPISGSFTYAWSGDDNGNVFSSEIPVTRGINNPKKNFVAPRCKTLRFTGTIDSQAVDRAHIAGLSKLTGLDFDFQVGATTQNYVQNVYPVNNTLHRQTFRLTETTDTTIVFTINNINEEIITFSQLLFGKESWLPTYNYDRGFRPLASVRRNRFESAGTSHQNRQSQLVQESFTFSTMEEAKSYELIDLDRYDLSDGYCLLEKDNSSDSLDDSYIANIYIEGINLPDTRWSMTVNAMEAFRK